MTSPSFSVVWCQASNEVIDPIVDALKRMRLWARCGRSLRLLNRHWCRHINQHVFAIRPHKSREVLRKHAISLAQFPHITSLDLVRFIGSGDVQMSRAVCLAMRQLPMLAQLRVPGTLCSVRPDVFTCLSGVTSLCLAEDCLPFIRQNVTMLSPLPLRELCVEKCGYRDLEVLLAQLPNLQSLSASILARDKHPFRGTRLNRIQSVKLKVFACDAVTNLLFGATSLTALSLSCAFAVSLRALIFLPKLVSLRLTSFSHGTLTSSAFPMDLTKLTGLSLEGNRAVSTDFLWNASHGTLKLQYLILKDLRIVADLGYTALTSLISLTLMHCHLDGVDLKPLKALKGLQKLCIIRVTTALDPEKLPSFVDSEAFPSLTTLTIDLEDEVVGRVKWIAGLAKLEIVGLIGRNALCISDLYPLDELNHLRDLGVFCEDACLQLNGTICPQVLTRLDSLWLDSHCVYSGMDDISIYNEIHQFEHELQRMAPHLKITHCPRGSVEFVDAHHVLPDFSFVDGD